MGAIASQITRLTVVYSTVYSDADQMASNAENVSIWWRHHAMLWGMQYHVVLDRVNMVPDCNMKYSHI